MNNRNKIALVLLYLFLQDGAECKTDIKAMLEGMGTSFGAGPDGYVYNYEIWSDANVPIYTEQQGYASFMGAYFPSAKGYYGKKQLPSIFDNPGANNVHKNHGAGYYFKLYIGTDSTPHDNHIYQQMLTQLPLEKHDPNIYFYHVYTAGGHSKGNSTHQPDVEMMGYQNPDEKDSRDAAKRGSVSFTSQLSSIAFYNSSGTDVQISLTYDKDPYTFTLEKYSYNTLEVPAPQPAKSSTTAVAAPASTGEKSAESAAGQTVITQAASESTEDSSTKEDAPQPPFSLRPNTITFSSYDEASQKYVKFRTLGLPDTSFEVGTFVIEIYQDPGKSLEVGIQGFNPGNYDLGVTARNRDITPCPCTFWHQSFQQGGSIEGYGNLPGQVWVVYGGVDSPVKMKVDPGQAVTWNLIRPLVKQGDQFVYFIYVVTTSDTVALSFVDKVVSQKIGQDVIAQYSTAINAPITTSTTAQNIDISGAANAGPDLSISATQEVAALMGNLSTFDGVIEDKDQGVIGYLLGTDVFTSKGLGFGRYYYTLAPSVVSVANLVSSVASCFDSSKTSSLGASDADVQKKLTTIANGWLAAYINNPADVAGQVQQYLVLYGNSKVVDDKGALTKYGQARLQSILTGPVSLKYPSLKLSTVTNQFVYDFGRSAPEKMPTPLTQDQVKSAAKSKLK